MKRNSTIFSGILILIALGFNAKADAIVIDGSFSDWDNVPVAHSNDIAYSGTLTTTKIFADANRIYFYLEGTNAFVLERFDIYFNADDNISTGFQAAGYPAGSGADILCQGNLSGGTIFNHAGGTGYNWNASAFTFASSMSFSAVVSLTGKKAIEFSIKKADIGITTGGATSFAFIDSDNSYAELGAMPQNNLLTSKFIPVPALTTLPVSLVYFSATQAEKAVKLNWSTASAQNNSHFEIYKSADGLVFEKIETVKGKEQSNTTQFYSISDQNPFAGNSYYQLKQVDLNGKATILKTIAFSSEFTNTSFNVYKLLGQDIVELAVFSQEKSDTQFILHDLTGKVLINSSLKLVTGYQTLRFPLNVKTGINIATLSTATKTISQKFFIN